MIKKFILASASQRRKEILSNAGYIFEIIPSKYDEKINGLKYSDNIVENCAYHKALDIHNTHKDSIVIASDTVVVLDGIILGKPIDKKDAFETLKKLSNKTHFVATSICVIKSGQIFKGVEKTYVTFRELSDNDILNYIEQKSPLDKAGSYGIQDEGFDFVKKIEGNLDNVIGFPMALFDEMLVRIN